MKKALIIIIQDIISLKYVPKFQDYEHTNYESCD